MANPQIDINLLTDLNIGAQTDLPNTSVDATPAAIIGLLKQNNVLLNAINVLLTTPALAATAATSTKQSDGSQKTQLVDSAGTELGTVGNPINVTGDGGGGGAVTIADGADATLGAKADAKSTATDATAISAMQVLKQISYNGQNPSSTPVTGTFWQATQPVSIAAAQTLSTVTTVGAVTEITNALPAGENQLGFVGQTIQSMAVEFTRDANATPMVAGDQISNATSPFLAFTNIARVNGGSIEVIGIEVITDLKSITPRIRVGFYNTNTATLSADLAPAQELYVDESKRIGEFDMPALATAADATNSTCSRKYTRTNGIPLIAGAGTRTIYADLKALDAFTPASGQKITLRLTYILN